MDHGENRLHNFKQTLVSKKRRHFFLFFSLLVMKSF